MIPVYEPTRQEVNAGMIAVLQRTLPPDGARLAVSRACVDMAVENDRQSAIMVPAVQFIVESTLATLESPAVEEKLPRDIKTRAHIAAETAERVTEIATRLPLIDKLYRKDPVLSKSPIQRNGSNAPSSLIECDEMASLGATPFLDAVMGDTSGFSFLGRAGVPVEDRGYIIARSTSLGAALSKIDRGETYKASVYLSIADPDGEHFTFNRRGDRLKFSENTLRYLETLYSHGGGCPILRLKSKASGQERNMLFSYWQDITRYLVPTDATL
jgi:hypothetical protein